MDLPKLHFDPSLATNAALAASAMRNQRRTSMNRLNLTTRAALGRYFLVLISALVMEWNLAAAPMVYTGLVVTDVRVGTTLMHNASLKITFEGDTEDILPVSTPPSDFCVGNSFFSLAKGVASMEIPFQGRTRTARLQEGQD